MFDHVGKNEFQSNIELMRHDSEYVSYGVISGSTVQNVDLRVLLNKRINFHFTTLRSRTDQYKAELISSFSKEVLPLIQQNKIGLSTHCILDFSKEGIIEAHRIVENNENIGKVIVKMI